MSLSADQREAIARAIYESDRGLNDEPWAESDKVERLEYLANADAIAPLVDGWLGEARRDEREQAHDEVVDILSEIGTDLEVVDRLFEWCNRPVVIEGSEATP